MSGDTFTCHMCHRTFEKAWTDEEADAEAQAKYGPHPNELMGITCDECTQEFDAWMRANVGDPRPGAITFEGRPLCVGDKLMPRESAAVRMNRESAAAQLYGWAMAGRKPWQVHFVGNMRQHAGALGFSACEVDAPDDAVPTSFREVDLRLFKRAED